MNITFEDAVNEGGRVKLAICGPAGGGKTVTLLKIASGLANGGPIAAIDTERGSMRKYAHKASCPPDCADPLHFKFFDIRPSTYHPEVAIAAIQKAHEMGIEVIVLDSLSHFWQGTGGELELVDQAAKRTQGNSFAAWKSVTPLHNKLIETMLATPIHVLASMRSKTEWVIEKNERTGKNEPRRIGLAPIMRDQIEFEFDVFGEINQEHEFIILKSRCGALKDGVFKEAGPEIAKMLLEWLPAKGAEPEKPKPAWVPIIEEFKQALCDDAYTAILKDHGYSSASAIELRDEGLKVHQAMRKAVMETAGGQNAA